MRSGGSSSKGSAFERKIAKALGKWYWNDPETLIRGGASGGLRTIRGLTDGLIRGEFVQIRHPENPFPFSVECKHYKDIVPLDILLTPSKHPFWKAINQCIRDAKQSDLIPLLIWKTNNRDELAVLIDGPPKVLPPHDSRYIKVRLPRQHDVYIEPLILFLNRDPGDIFL